MYADCVACCSLVSHSEYADGTDKWTDWRTPDHYIMLSARCGQRDNASSVCNIQMLESFSRLWGNTDIVFNFGCEDAANLQCAVFTTRCYASAVYVVVMCLSVRSSVCLFVRPSVCHKPALYQNGLTFDVSASGNIFSSLLGGG